MFKREMKINLKNFLIWTGILLALFLMVYLIYPSLVDEKNISSMNDMMKMFPEDVLKAFNMDISGIDSAFGWLKTEGFVFLLLITGVYSSILGSNILLKEENDKTIEYLNSLPITRKQIILSKIICGLIYITAMIFMVGVFNYIGLYLSGDFNKKEYLCLSVTPWFSSVVFFSLSLFLSTFTHKTKKVFGMSLGIVFISYFLQILSQMSEKAEKIKYLSIFTLADIRNVIEKQTLNAGMISVAIVLTIIFLVMAAIHYDRKELV